jgi:hypothetical protein
MHVGLAVMLAGAVSACSSGSPPVGANSASFQPQTAPASEPLALTADPAATSSITPPVALPLPEQQVAQAVHMYRLNNKLPPGQAQWAGTDLNGDGRPEAVVRLDLGTLVVLMHEPQGYRPVSATKNVGLPVRVAAERTEGWHDLLVGNDAGAEVRLRFTPTGYPATTAFQPTESTGGTELAQTLIGEGQARTASQLPVAYMPNGMVPLGADAEEGAAGQ